MQLYALDSKGNILNARKAQKQVNYYCLECQQIVRLRGGPHRQSHFYHLEPTPLCRQYHKGLVHLQLQAYFKQQLPLDDCQLELRFSSIHRIADVAWLSERIVFEIQCSPISAKEVLERNQDYQQIGWSVIWILHDRRYNQTRLSAAEIALRSSPHFFTNMNDRGEGILYDQFDICTHGIRQRRLPPLPIQLKTFSVSALKQPSWPLLILKQRAASWNVSLEGDLLSCYLKNDPPSYLKQAHAMEKQAYSSSFHWSHLVATLYRRAIVIPYQKIFRFLLERMCRS